MATTFAHEAGSLTITQSGRGFRVGFWIFIVIGLSGVAINVVLSAIREPTTIDCDRARKSCTLTRGNIATPMPLASITSTKLTHEPSRTLIEIDRNQYPSYLEACASRDPHEAPAIEADARALQTFLDDATQASLHLECASQSPAMGNPLLFAVFFGFGVLVLRLLLAPFSTEIRTRFDRAAGTLTVRGRRWFMRAWSIERKISDIAKIELTSRLGPYGARYYTMHARFSDGASVVIWKPSAAGSKELAMRQGEVQRFVTGG